MQLPHYFPHGLTLFLAMQCPRPLTFDSMCDSLFRYDINEGARPVDDGLSPLVTYNQLCPFS